MSVWLSTMPIGGKNNPSAEEATKGQAPENLIYWRCLIAVAKLPLLLVMLGVNTVTCLCSCRRTT
jgi:hypothetical protein